MSVNQKKEGAVSFEDIIQDFTFEVPGVQEEETIETTELDFSEQEKEVEQKEVVEEKKPEVQEQLKVEEQPEESAFFKLTKKLIDSGKWSDAEIEDEEGNTIKLSEYKNLSEEEYFELLEQQKEAERNAKQRDKLIQDTVGTFAKSAARSLGGSTGQKIVRGLLGSLFGRK